MSLKTLLTNVAGPLLFQDGRRELQRDVVVESLARALKLVPEQTLNPNALLSLGAPTATDYRRAEEALELLLGTGIVVPVRGDAVRFADPDLEHYFRVCALASRARRGTWRPAEDPLEAGWVLGLFSDGGRLRDAQALLANDASYGHEVPPSLVYLVSCAAALGIGEPLDRGLEARAVEVLLAHLDSPYADVAARARAALALLDRPETALRLVGELARPGSPRAFDAALEAVTSLGHPAAAPGLLLLARDPATPLDRRGRLLRAAARVGGEDVVSAVLAAAAGTDPALAGSALAEPALAEPALAADAALALSDLLADDVPLPADAVEALLAADPARFGGLVAHLPRLAGRSGAWALRATLAYLAAPDATGAGDPASARERAASAVAGFGPEVRGQVAGALRASPTSAWLALALAELGDADVGALTACARACAGAPGTPAGLTPLTVALRALLRAGPEGEAALVALDAELGLGAGLLAGPADAGATRALLSSLAASPRGPDLLRAWAALPAPGAARLPVLDALAAVDREAASTALLGLLDDPDAATRRGALAVVARCPSERVAAALAGRLARAAGPERPAVLAALAQVWTRSTVEPFEEALLARPAPDAPIDLTPERLELAAALGASRRPAFFEVLKTLLTSSQPDAWRVAPALAALGDPRAREALVTQLAGLDPAAAPPAAVLTLLRALERCYAALTPAERHALGRPAVAFDAYLRHGDLAVQGAAHDLWVATAPAEERR